MDIRGAGHQLTPHAVWSLCVAHYKPAVSRRADSTGLGVTLGALIHPFIGSSSIFIKAVPCHHSDRHQFSPGTLSWRPRPPGTRSCLLKSLNAFSPFSPAGSRASVGGATYPTICMNAATTWPYQLMQDKAGVRPVCECVHGPVLGGRGLPGRGCVKLESRGEGDTLSWDGASPRWSYSGRSRGEFPSHYEVHPPRDQ